MPRGSQGLLICGVSRDLFYGKELDTLKRGGRRVEQRHREPGVGPRAATAGAVYVRNRCTMRAPSTATRPLPGQGVWPGASRTPRVLVCGDQARALGSGPTVPTQALAGH